MEQLQQAAAAISAGQKKEAYLLLAQVLKQDQNNVDAWTMLSQVADTPAQERLFLEKAARIDPENAEVQARIAALSSPVEPDTHIEPEAEELMEPAEVEPAAAPQPMRISDDPFDYDAQAEGDTLPPWLAGEEQYLAVDQAMSDNAGMETTQASLTVPEMDVPDWLKEEPEESWLEDTIADETPEPATQPAGDIVQPAVVEKQPPEKSKKKRRKPSSRVSTLLEWVIAGLAIILFLLLIYYLAS